MFSTPGQTSPAQPLILELRFSCIPVITLTIIGNVGRNLFHTQVSAVSLAIGSANHMRNAGIDDY